MHQRTTEDPTQGKLNVCSSVHFDTPLAQEKKMLTTDFLSFHTRTLPQKTVSSRTLSSNTDQSAAFNLNVELLKACFNSVIGLLKTELQSSTTKLMHSNCLSYMFD